MTTQQRARSAKIPAQRQQKHAAATTASARPAHRFHLDTMFKDLTPAQRAERGRRIRSDVPRSSHANFDDFARRRDPIEALICGDAHVANFGLFGTAERRLVFDINDFDETLPGPWEWDVQRLAASLEIAARDNAIKTRQRCAIVRAAVRQYRLAMAMFAGQSNLAVWYASADIDRAWQQFAPHLGSRERVGLAKGAAKARTRDSMRALGKLTMIVDGRPRIVADPPLVVPLSSLIPQDMDACGIEDRLVQLVDRYRRTLPGDRRYLLDQYQFEQSDVARKVVGVGSVGTRCWIMLMLGKDAGDPLILQIKEAGPAVLSDFVGLSKFDNQGQRVVEGQRLMQAASDVFLGWLRVSPAPDGVTRDFYVRQLRDWKFSFDTQAMAPSGLSSYGEICGWTLARTPGPATGSR